jgi:hypothetical protein
MTSVLADRDVLGISYHVLCHWIQVGGTVWKVGKVRMVTSKFLLFDFILPNYTEHVWK